MPAFSCKRGSEALIVRLRHELTTALCALSTLLGQYAKGDEKLIEQVRVAHNTAVSQIRSISCDITIASEAPAAAYKFIGKYWRLGNAFRIKEKYPDGSEGTVVGREFDVFSWSDSRPKEGGFLPVLRKARSEMPAMCDVWDNLLLEFPGTQLGRLPLDDLLALKHKRRQAVETHVSGVPCVHLSLVIDLPHAKEELNMDLYFRKDANYLVGKLRKIYAAPGAPEVGAEITITDFEEVAPAVFFPVGAVHKPISPVASASSSLVSISNLKINQNTAEQEVSVRFPGPVRITDKIRGTVYDADVSGNSIRVVGSTSKGYVAVARPSTMPIPVNSSSQQTEAEPRSASFVITVSSIGLLVFLISIWLWRYRKGQTIK